MRPRRLGLRHHAQLADLVETIGQARAVSSVAFGMGIHNDGYNIYAAGATGTGKATTINEFLSGEVALRRLPTTGCM